MSGVESDRATILVADGEYATAVQELASRFPQLDLRCPVDEEKLAETGPQAVGLVAQDVAVDQALLSRLPSLRAVLKLGRNYANIDAAAVRERRLAFGAVPRKGPNCVAELAMTMILALSKDLLISHRSVAEGAYRLRGLRPEPTAQWKMAFHWMRHTALHEVTGKVLGIVGMGEIGYELARRASAMGMEVRYFKRRRLSPEVERSVEASYRDLPELLRESDYVCLAVPHTTDTERMIGAGELELMKSNAFLVNICRGGVLDEAALIDALKSGRIAGAGLDVFTFEPLPADSPLCHLDNVILTPHVGGGTGTTRPGELSVALEQLVSMLAGEPPRIDLGRQM
jgi:phosphoglycerate dehydrogenase-like enzyme